ncbi:MAG: ABC transporter ATP-binding protein [Syntrophales bacterium]|jgi:iron complex transport system ATP-binding protein|nr:ABC transporter ATP-binding protein [Syntrophales bacterium]
MTARGMTLIEARDVTFAYDSRPVLRDVSLTVRRGEVISLLGPNGSGKSTLLKVLLGLLRPSRGSVRLKGTEIGRIDARAVARQIAYVPQSHRGAFSYKVIDVVLMGRLPHKPFFFSYSGKDRDIAHEKMARLSIAHLAERPYTELSGGERQLTLIARAMAQGAEIFVLDEPAAGLDYGNQLRLLEEIIKLAREGYTFIKSTHSPEHAFWLGDRSVMIKEGAVIGDGKTASVVTNESLFALYQARVSVVRINGSFRVCVPHAIDSHTKMTVTGEEEKIVFLPLTL